MTGGAGFLGCNLVRKLLGKEEMVIVYDNFSFGKKENIAIKNRNLRIIKGDINNQKLLKETVKKYKPNIIVHLAALHFIPYCNSHPCETLRVNVEGTQSLMEVIKNPNVQMMLAASSAAVYAMNDGANKETDIPAPYDIYGISKLFMERLVNSFQQETGKKCVNMRLFNIYGHYETNPHLIPRIMEQFAAGKEIIELGNLTPKRGYIYTDDVADAIVALSSDAYGHSETYNIGTGKEYSVTEIVDMLNAITGRKVTVKSVAKYRRAVEREHLLANISKIKNETGWEPKYSIEEGLQKTAEFYRLI